MVLGSRNLNVAAEQRYWGKAQDLCCSNTDSDGRLSLVFYLTQFLALDGVVCLHCCSIVLEKNDFSWPFCAAAGAPDGHRPPSCSSKRKAGSELQVMPVSMGSAHMHAG